MTTNRQPQYRTIETDTIEFLRAQVAALTKENERLKALAYPKELRITKKPLEAYPACNKPIHEPNCALGKSVLLFITYISPLKIEGYGFINNVFKDKRVWYWPENNVIWAIENFVQATPQEVESVLKSEAEKRYKAGQLVKSPNAELPATLIDLHHYKYEESGNRLLYFYDEVMCIPVFDNGKWAEIIEQPKEIDFSISGQNAKLIELISQLLNGVDFANGNKEALYEITTQTRGRLKEITIKNK